MAIDVLKQHIPGIKENGIVTDSTVTLTGTTTITAPTLSGTTALASATVSSTLDVTGASTLGGAVNMKRQVTTGGAFATPIVLTEAQSGRYYYVADAAGLDFTLPAVAAAQVGTTYTFHVAVTISSNSLRITAASGDLLYGGVISVDFDTGDKVAHFAPDGNDLIYTANGSTTGGKQGTWVEYTAASATAWLVRGVNVADGTMATPFS